MAIYIQYKLQNKKVLKRSLYTMLAFKKNPCYRGEKNITTLLWVTIKSRILLL